MKIVFVVADITARGGIERVITTLASALSKCHEVEIISIHRSQNSIAYRLESDVKISYIDKNISSIGKPGSFLKLLRHVSSSFELTKVLKSRKGSFIIANSLPISLLCFPAKLLNSKSKYIAVEHVHYHYYSKIIVMLRKFIYKKFHHVVALTQRDAELYSKNNCSVSVIENPLSFIPKKYNNVSKRNNKIIAVGRLEHQKGFDILIKSFHQLNEKTKNEWKLDIYGEGSLKMELQEQINRYDLNNQICLKGLSNKLEYIYADYDIFVLSSRFEGFGMVILEAMSCGLPVISFDCPTGPREILDKGEAGVLVTDMSDSALSAALQNLINNPFICKDYAQKSLKRSLEFSLDTIVSKWDELIDKLSLDNK